MMFHYNRDLLAINPRFNEDKFLLEKEIEMLHALLKHTETFDSFCIPTEIIDLNRHKIIVKPARILKYLQDKSNPPFVFYSNKN
jgi:hypothetical protein